MDNHSIQQIFLDPLRKNSDDTVEEEPQEEQGKDEISSNFEEEGEVEDDKAHHDLWRPLR